MLRQRRHRQKIGAGRDLVAAKGARQQHPAEPQLVQPRHQRRRNPPRPLDLVCRRRQLGPECLGIGDGVDGVAGIEGCVHDGLFGHGVRNVSIVANAAVVTKGARL